MAAGHCHTMKRARQRVGSERGCTCTHFYVVVLELAFLQFVSIEGFWVVEKVNTREVREVEGSGKVDSDCRHFDGVSFKKKKVAGKRVCSWLQRAEMNSELENFLRTGIYFSVNRWEFPARCSKDAEGNMISERKFKRLDLHSNKEERPQDERAGAHR